MNLTMTFIGIYSALGVIALGVPILTPWAGAVFLGLMIFGMTPYLIKGFVLRRELAKFHFGSPDAKVTFWLYMFTGLATGLYWAGVSSLVFIPLMAINTWLVLRLPTVRNVSETDRGLFWTALSMVFIVAALVSMKTAGYKYEPITAGTVTMWAIAYVPLSLFAAFTVSVALPIINAERQYPETERLLLQFLVEKGIKANRANLEAVKREVPDIYRAALKMASNDKTDAYLDLLERSGHGFSMFRGYATLSLFPIVVGSAGPFLLMNVAPFAAMAKVRDKYDIQLSMQDIVRGTRVVRV